MSSPCFSVQIRLPVKALLEQAANESDGNRTVLYGRRRSKSHLRLDSIEAKDDDDDYINVHSKADRCQLNLPYRTRNYKQKRKELKT